MGNSKEFGKKLKTMRLQRQLSQEALAFQCNMQPSHIGQLEREKKNPTLDTIVKISNGLDIPLQELLDFDIDIKTEKTNKTMNEINAYLTALTPKQQEQILAIIKTFIEYK